MKKQFLVRSISVGALAFVLVFSPVKAPKSEAWLEFAGQMMANQLAITRKTIDDIINGAGKQMAVQVMYAEISGIVGGTSSQNSRIIGNYRDFLNVEPTQRTNIYMNDYLSQITRGRGSSSSYIPYNEGFGNGAFVGGLNNGNYMAQLRQTALNATVEQRAPQLAYIGDPSQNLFANGNMDNFLDYSRKTQWLMRGYSKGIYNERLEIEKDAARTEAIAGRGFKGTRQGDTITTPGSLVGDNMANVQNLGLNVIANANGLPEIITSAVLNIYTKSISNGIGNAQRNVSREIQNVADRGSQAIDSQIQTSGPGAAYSSEGRAAKYAPSSRDDF